MINSFHSPLRSHRVLLALVGGVAVLLRLPLVLLPAPGRDEAAYVYWAHHPEPFYAPLLQGLLWLGDRLALPFPWSVRGPSLVGGLVALGLLELLLRRRALPPSSRLLAVAALAWSPWQIYVGAIAHPDALLLPCLLLFAWAGESTRPGWLVVATFLAALSKPTGLLLMPVAVGLLLRSRAIPLRHSLPAVAGMIALAVSGIALADPTFLRGLGELGRLDASLPVVARLPLGLLSLVGFGGLLLPLGGARGLGQLDRLRRGEAGAWAGWVLVVVFALAAVFRGQVKGNWLLPGLVLLWPDAGLRLPRPVLGGALLLTILPSLALSWGTLRPEAARGLEERVPFYSLYGLQAGEREARVSPTRRFWQRVEEHRSLEPWCRELGERWGGDLPPRWLVADDYGLASQIAFARPGWGLRLVLPTDPVFHRSLPAASGPDPLEGILVMGVLRSPETLWTGSARLERLASLPHPVTGEPVHLARVVPDPTSEEP